MASAVITKLHSRVAALFVFGAFVLFTAIPVLHAVCVAPDHHSDQCPICQTLRDSGNLPPVDTATIVAADFLPQGTVCRGEVFVPTSATAPVHHTRAPPAA